MGTRKKEVVVHIERVAWIQSPQMERENITIWWTMQRSLATYISRVCLRHFRIDLHMYVAALVPHVQCLQSAVHNSRSPYTSIWAFLVASDAYRMLKRMEKVHPLSCSSKIQRRPIKIFSICTSPPSSAWYLQVA